MEKTLKNFICIIISSSSIRQSSRVSITRECFREREKKKTDDQSVVVVVVYVAEVRRRRSIIIMGAQKPGKNNAGGGGGAASSIGSDSSPIKFEAMFETIDVDPDGKKFDRVSRFVCRSTPYGDAEVTVDVNVDVYPIEVGTKFTYVLASTLNTYGSPEDPTTFDQTAGKESLADEYEYVTHGKCYKKTEPNDDADASEKTATYISFGGLLACLKTDAKAMSEVDVDDRVYCLMRKIGASER